MEKKREKHLFDFSLKENNSRQTLEEKNKKNQKKKQKININRTMNLKSIFLLLALSSNGFAEPSEVSYYFSNGNRAVAQVESTPELSYWIDLHSSSEDSPQIKKIHQGKGLKLLISNQAKKTFTPKNHWLHLRTGEERLFFFKDIGHRYWLIEDGTLSVACGVKEGPPQLAHLFELGAERYIYEGNQQGVNYLLRVRDGKCIKIQSTSNTPKEILIPEIQEDQKILLIPGSSQSIDLTDFKVIHAVRHGSDVFTLSSKTSDQAHQGEFQITRIRDQKVMTLFFTIERSTSPSLNDATLKNGLLSLPATHRLVDLNEFDAEVKFAERVRRADPVF
ncbi:MAG: hypothetical protein ACO3A2_10205, partial [Bdellovibrionia bacterium]